MKRYVFTIQIIIIVALLLLSLSSLNQSDHVSAPKSVHMGENETTLFTWQITPSQPIDTNPSIQMSVSSEANEQTVPEQVFRVMIDAGHGGRDPGSPGVSEQEEKNYTLSLAMKVYRLLQMETEITPILTRDDDSYMTTDERVAMANLSEVDVFISLHANSFINEDTSGTETYYYNRNSEQLASILHEELVQATGFLDRDVREMDYKVVKETTMPAALLEIGYFSNPIEESMMITEQMQNKVALSIVKGIKRYMNL